MNLSDSPAHSVHPPVKRSRNPLWAVFEIWAMAWGLGLFVLVCIGTLPVLITLHLLLPRDGQTPVVRGLISRVFRVYLFVLRWVCCTRCDTSELDTLKHEGPLIVVANHPSLLDVVVLTAQLPNATCIVKAAVLRNPLYIIASRMAGYISNHNAQDMLARSRAELAAGSHFIFFPEGGRSRQFPISSFSGTCILLARLTKTPIQTVLLDYSSPYLGKNWGLLSRPALPLRIHARLGKRFLPADMGPETRNSLESYYRAQLRLGWL